MSNTVAKVKVTEAALKRFLNVALGLGTPSCWCHQTLTFKDKKHSIEAVKEPLNLLLDSLHKRFGMSSFYAIESGEERRLHVHVLFLFYESSPFKCEDWLSKFRPLVFKAWNEINGGGLCRQANEANTHTELDPTYFIKHIETLPRGESKTRGKANWWGVRNKKLMEKYRVPVDQSRLKGLMRKHKAAPSCKPLKVHPNRMFSYEWTPSLLLEDDPALWDQEHSKHCKSPLP